MTQPSEKDLKLFKYINAMEKALLPILTEMAEDDKTSGAEVIKMLIGFCTSVSIDICREQEAQQREKAREFIEQLFRKAIKTLDDEIWGEND